MFFSICGSPRRQVDPAVSNDACVHRGRTNVGDSVSDGKILILAGELGFVAASWKADL